MEILLSIVAGLGIVTGILFLLWFICETLHTPW